MLHSELRSDRDMDNIHNAEDALYEFDRANTDSDLATWARKWGRVLAKHCAVHNGELSERVEVAEKELTDAENALEALQIAVAEQVDALDSCAEYLIEPGPKGLDIPKLDKLLGDISKALTDAAQ